MSVFRRQYRALTENEKSLVDDIKARAEVLHELFGQPTQDPRAMALARTKLEESVMWAVKGITG